MTDAQRAEQAETALRDYIARTTSRAAEHARTVQDLQQQLDASVAPEELRQWKDRARQLETHLRHARHTLKRLPCQFWACEGPDAPYQDMKTCIRCAMIQDLDAILK